jgi:hypothetical protein
MSTTPDPRRELGEHARERLKTYTEAELAAALGLEIDTLRQWRYRRAGGPAFFKIGRSVFYRESALNDWFDRHTADGKERL